jgi:hypothetical protein
MSSCPAGVQTGFVQLAGPITQPMLTDLQVKSAPCTASFAPRSIVPSLISNIIDETAENTILYKEIRYQLLGGAQICQPTHSGYNLPGNTKTPEADLVLTYVNMQVVSSYPQAILMIVPIYNTTSSKHAGYIQQFVNSNNPVASLQTVFFESNTDNSQVSLVYNTCTDLLSKDGQHSSVRMRCAYYPNGISLTGQDFNAFMSIITQQGQHPIPPYYLPPVVRNTYATVTSYIYNDDGKKVPQDTSTVGVMMTTQLSTSAPEFKNRYQYFIKPITLSSRAFKDTCPYYATSQYKCMPFHSLKDLSGNMVIPGGVTLEQMLEAKAKQDIIDKGTGSSGILLEVVAPIAGALTIAVVLTLVGGPLVRYFQRD